MKNMSAEIFENCVIKPGHRCLMDFNINSEALLYFSCKMIKLTCFWQILTDESQDMTVATELCLRCQGNNKFVNFFFID